MAAAIILIPEMLSGPDRSERPEQATARAQNETDLKTYSIDLNHPPGASNAQAVPDERAPPPEQASLRTDPLRQERIDAPTAATPAAEDEPNPEALRGDPRPQTSQPAADDSSARSKEQDSSREPASERAPAAKPVETPAAPLASAPSVPTSRGWAVQVGSFSTRASAERVAADFRSERNDVFVMPVKSGGATLYRVRIGPMPDRAAAEETLRRVRTKVSGAAVVTHP